MSESGENQVAVEVIDETPVENQEAAAPEKPQERVKRPTRPDDAAHKQKVEALQAVINTNKKRVEEIKQIFDDRKNGRSASSSGQQGIKNKLAELKSQFQTVLKQKQHLRAQMETASKTREAVRASLRDLKANMKFTTVEQIDEAIEKLENRVQHSSLSLNEEKKILDDIRKLKASRSAVGEYTEKLETLAQDDTARSELQAGIKALDEELNKVKAEEEVLRAELAVIREKEQEKGSDVPGLIAEREEAREVCKQAYEKIKDLRAEHDGVWQEFKAQEKLWREQQNEDRQRRQKEYAAEKAARDAERAARIAEMAPEPFDKEITMCEQLTAYIGRFTAASAGPAQEESSKTTEVVPLDGMKVFARKAEDEADAWLTGLGGGKKGKGKKKGVATATAAAPAPVKIVHSLDMLDAFATLKISVPTSGAAMSASLTEVEAKKAEFLKKREEAKAAKETATAVEGAESSDAAAAAPEATNGSEEAVEGDAAPKKKAAKKGAAQAPPKLDDAESWPTMGGEPAGETIAAAVDESKPTAAEVAKGASPAAKSS